MTRPATTFDREVALARLADEEFDVVVIGGGITGAGVALEAAARGLRTALVERGDFASGTSSKSSKLVHGGLRYLQQKEIGLVHESLAERHRLLRNAPHLVEPLTFLIPLFGKGGVVDKTLVRAYSSALWLYDLAGGWKIGKRHKRISSSELAGHFPTLRTDRLVAGFLYYDARTDDARLTLTVVRTAVLDHGAVAVNYAPVTGFEHDSSGKVTGVRISPVDSPRSGEVAGGGPGTTGELVVRAKAVVNATGVWADDLRLLDEPGHRRSIRPAKGIHLTVASARLPCDLAGVIPVAKDRRSIFVVPWGDHTYLGTTDTDYEGPVDDPRVEVEDVEYILAAINAAFTSELVPADVTGSWAGLRPLLARTDAAGHHPSERTADLSRRHRVERSASGVVSITGGKLTTYRKMGEDTIDAVERDLGRRSSKSPTKRLALRGAAGLEALRRPGRAAALGVNEAQLSGLLGRYGGETPAVLGLAKDRPELAEPLQPGLAHLAAEVVYAARYEMATCVEDVLSRRTRAQLLDADAARLAARRTAELLALELDWDEARVAAEVAGYSSLEQHDLAAAELLAAREPTAAPPAAPAPPPRLAARRATGARHPTPPGPAQVPTSAARRGERARRRSGRRSGGTGHVAADSADRVRRAPAAELTERLGGARVAVGEALLERLRSACATVETTAEARAEAGRDWWPITIRWALAGGVPALPGAVARPTSTAEVAAVLAICNEAGVPVTAAGGRSGVCGASVPAFGGVSLDCCGLRGLEAVDDASLLVDVRAGTFGPELESTLRAEHGLTVGHWPQSMDLATVGGWIACRGAGQYSTRYGKIEDIVAGLEVVLADGTVTRTGAMAGAGPRSATGPDLTQLFVGSEGTLGVITSARLRAHPLPVGDRRAAYCFGSFADGLDALRRTLRRGATPAVVRLYDATESARSFELADTNVLIALDEGDAAIVDASMSILDEECRGAAPADVALVERWLGHRNDTSALQSVTRAGIVVDTIEVAGPWGRLAQLYDDALASLRSVDGLLAASAHESHAYLDGACLYFTFAGRGADTADDEWATAFYRRCWQAVMAACAANGASISHHHGIGLVRGGALPEALGEGYAVLESLKAALDPHGILNPGKLGLPSPFGERPW